VRFLLLALLLAGPASAAGDGIVLQRDVLASCGGQMVSGGRYLGMTVGQVTTGESVSQHQAEVCGFWVPVNEQGAWNPGAVDVGRLPDRGDILTGLITPNPFRGTAEIRITVPADAGPAPEVAVRIFDIVGRMIRILKLESDDSRAVQYATWDGRDDSGSQVCAGIYFCKLQVGNRGALRRMILIR
jgi:hypothetical protein